MRPNVEPDSREFTRSLFFLFVISMVAASLLGGLSLLTYSYVTKDFVGDLLERERFGVQVRKDVMEESLEKIVADLEFLGNQERLRKYIKTGASSLLSSLSRDYLTFARYKDEYDQIRLFDKSGNEIVRVNHNSGLPYIVPAEKLQNKGKRYYFRDTIVLPRGDIFVSPMDLNIENGQVEVPHKPMIRFGMPLHDDSGMSVGALILNYKADRLLGALRRAGGMTPGQTMLLNSNGYWLLSSDTREQWGFMFPDKANVTFGSKFPRQWSRLHARESGQIIAPGKIFTFTTIYPLNKRLSSGSGSEEAFGKSHTRYQGDRYYWKLVSYIPNAQQQGFSLSLSAKLFLTGGSLAAFVCAASWILGLLITRRKLYRHVNAVAPLRDKLTGLANDRLYEYRLDEVMDNSMDTGGFALLRVRVDDLDMINNTYGDEVGDGLLLQIGLRLKGSFAPSETVARMGGSEFVCILTRVNDSETLEEVTANIRNVMGVPFKLYESHLRIAMTISSGLYPQDEPTPDKLLASLRNT